MRTDGQPALVLPVKALALEITGTAVAVFGVLITFVPEVLATALPAALHGVLTPAVGWTAIGVGFVVSGVGAWELVADLRRQKQAAYRR